MGVVYRAQDPAIGRTVAIKTIRLSDFSDPAENSRLRDRLFREAQSAGILSHPGIVTIYDIAEEGGFAYIFMEFVDGPTLEKVLASETPPGPQEVLSILRQAAAALDYAHRKGIVHRDIKPANIMIHEDGTPKIADFGVAKMLSHNMTQAGAIIGTPNYMSPEQVQGKPVDGRADQFSLAVIAYEILTGERPFAADSLPTLLFKMVAEDPPLPHRLNPTLPREVNAVILRSMSKNSEGRYTSCSEFISAMELALENGPAWQPIAAGTSQSIPTAASPTNASQNDGQRSPPRVAPPAPPIANAPPPETIRRPAVPAAPPAPPIIQQSMRQTRDTYIPAPPIARAPVVKKKGIGLKTPAAALFSLALIGGLLFGLYYLAGQKKTASVQKPVQEPTFAASSNKEDQRKPSAAGTSEPQNPAPIVVDPRETDPVVRPPNRGPERPSESPQQGGDYVVRVNTNPGGANIVFDTKQTCTSPCTVPLSPGRHTLSAVLGGYTSAVRIFELPRDSSLNIDLQKPTGTLAISTRPAGATIVIDGQERREKSPAIITLSAGKHTLSVYKEGLARQDAEVEIKDGSTSEAVINWE